MPETFEVSFNSPQCGWMSIGFADATNEFHTTTAHAPHERALAELLEILSDLLDENSPRGEYVLQWNRSPEEFDFQFRRDGANVILDIFQYPTEERETKNREKVFTHSGEIADVCRAFAETFKQLYADRETDEFEFNWRQPFPFAAFAAFKEKVGI